MRWIRRVLIALGYVALGIVILLVILVFTRPSWQHEWAPPDNGVELASKWPVLKISAVRSGSAFDLLQRAAEAESKTTRPPEVQKELVRLNIEPWTDSSFPVLAKLLRENQKTLELARSAANAPDPQVPTYTSLTDQVPYASPVMRINDLFRASAASKASAGDFVGAYAELETSMAFVQILSRGGVLIHVLVEMVCETQAARAMRLIALQHDVPGEVANRAIERVLTTIRTIEPLAETFRAEYRSVPSTVDMFFDPSKPSILGFVLGEQSVASERYIRSRMKWFGWFFGSTRESVIVDVGRVYKSLVEVAEKRYRPSELQRLEQTLVPPMKPCDWILARDPLGYMLTQLTLPTFTPIIVRYQSRLADLNATAVVLAARQFEHSERRPPAALQDLVPNYLAEIPLDPYDGAPLRFSLRAEGKWIVYSVGPNQIDDGGEQPTREPKNYDAPGDLVFCQCEVDVAKERIEQSAKKMK